MHMAPIMTLCHLMKWGCSGAGAASAELSSWSPGVGQDSPKGPRWHYMACPWGGGCMATSTRSNPHDRDPRPSSSVLIILQMHTRVCITVLPMTIATQEPSTR